MSEVAYFKEVKEIFVNNSQDGIYMLSELCDISYDEAKKIISKYQDLETSRAHFATNERMCIDIDDIKNRILLTYAALASICNIKRTLR